MKQLQFQKRGWVIFLAFILTSLIVSSVFAGGPTGSSPNDPWMVPTDVQTLAPNTTLWFYFDYGPESGGGGFGRRGPTRSKVNVTVDADGTGRLQFGIYTPAQATDWMRDPTTAPVGRGTPYYDTLTDAVVHDLYWSGAFNTAGRYFVAITNNSSVPVAFRLTITGDAVTLYPEITPTPTPTLPVPFTVTPVPTGTLQGKVLFETATGGAIYTVNGDGSNLALVSHGIDPSWSPSGKQITFARWDNAYPGLYIANADGSNEKLVFGAPRIRWPRWSPDGKYLVFSQDKSPNDRTLRWKLGVVEVATGKLVEPQCSNLCFVPSWNTDSVTVVYTDPGVGIMRTNIFSGPASLILGPTGSYWDTGANIPRPILTMPPIQLSELSPDGKRIAYSQQAHDRWELNVVNADGSNSTAITKPDLIQSLFFDMVDHNVAPTWSPDSQQILFLSDRNGKWEFFTANADGSNIRQVLKNVTDLVPLKFTYENERMMGWTQ